MPTVRKLSQDMILPISIKHLKLTLTMHEDTKLAFSKK